MAFDHSLLLPAAVPGFPLGRFRGIPIRIRWETLLVYPLVTLGALVHGGLGFAAAMLAALVASVLAHECAHAEVARRFGVPVLLIELTGFGGLCWLENRPIGTRRRCAYLAAGPLANLAIALALGAMAACVPAADRSTLAFGALAGAMMMNVALGLFNLIPAFPLDGGAIALTLLETRMTTRTATLCISGFAVIVTVPALLVCCGAMMLGAPLVVALDTGGNWHLFKAAWSESRRERHVAREARRLQTAGVEACDAVLAAIVARAGAERRRVAAEGERGLS